MTLVEPVIGERAAIADVGDVTALVVSDVHTGIESELRSQGLEIQSQAASRRNKILALLEETNAEKVIFLGDLAHWIGEPQKTERKDIIALIEEITERVPAVLIKGNHDGAIEKTINIPVSEPSGKRLGDVGFVHGNSWPNEDVLSADVLCVGHEHPVVRIEDEVGGSRIETVWVRGELDHKVFETNVTSELPDELILFPAFNKLVSGTWINIPEQEFLSPFLPDALKNAEVFLLDGTRLGDYSSI